MQQDAIVESLERVAAKVGDPSPLVYDRLFAARPDLEDLFFMDNDGGVRGSMLQQCFDCILDALEGGVLCQSVIPSECSRHVAYGVEPDLFFSFFRVIRDTLRAELDGDWTRQMETAWENMISLMETHKEEAA
jgi:hemoglobin-like flavoprotein